MSHTNRIILLIDMDCFYCQVEENLNPSWIGKPLAVVQYNQWRGGGIIAVNYPAREKGVTRHMRGNDAKEKCPEILLAKVPEVRGKADLSRYRDAGKRVADVLLTFTPYLERASVDEAYLDITNIVEKRIQEKNYYITESKLLNTFVVGNTTSNFIENVTRHKEYDESNFKLALGGVIAEEIRAEVFRVTGYRCSAGVAHNKILAKLVCGLHKPNKQTILPHQAVPELYENMPVRKIKSLGGKFGQTVVEKLNIEFMAELARFSQKELDKKFDEKMAFWLYNVARGIDTEPVNTRLISKSIGCCKKFPGKTALCDSDDVQHWLGELTEEISERLEKDLEENGRKARQMVVSFAQDIGNEEINGTRSHPLTSYEQRRIFEVAFKIVQNNCLREDGSYRVVLLGISVGNFQDVKKIKEITSFFKNMKDNVRKEIPSGDDIAALNTSNIHAVNTNNKAKVDIECERSSDTSIYSQTTEEGDIDDCDNLIYYEQVHPASVANQNFTMQFIEAKELAEDSDVSHDSISNEVTFENINNAKSVDPRIAPTDSFFSKYFSGNINRNFNTSKPLDDINDLNDSTEAIHDNVNSATMYLGIENVELNNTCPECGKTIDSMDLQSHLDYHYAINMVKNEAHLYKNENIVCLAQSSSTSAGKKKRKEMNAASSHRPIGEYFKNDSSKKLFEEEIKDVCEECNKPVPLREWEVHMDYHAAKKLHLEMNVSRSERLKTGRVDAELKGQKNIMGFLKSSRK